MSGRTIYLDYNATTPLAPEAAEAMQPYLSDEFANPSSLHHAGRRVREAVEQSRADVASMISAQPDEVVWTSGGTEANNLAIAGTIRTAAWAGRKPHVVTTAIEHHSVLHCCEALERLGAAEVTVVSVDRDGLVDPGVMARALRENTALVSVMHANNEVGTVQPVEDIAAVVRASASRAVFHVDAVQTAGKLDVDVRRLGVDLLTLSAHKCYGPKGVGALWARRGVRLDAQLRGGRQERGMRGGTEAVPNIVGFGAAARLADERLDARQTAAARLAGRFLDALRARVDGVRLNGHPVRRLSGTVNVTFDGVDGEALIIQCDLAGLCLSLGAACDTGSVEASHVLLAMGRTDAEAKSSVRFSFGEGNTDRDADEAVEIVTEIVERLRGRSGRRVTIGKL